MLVEFSNTNVIKRVRRVIKYLNKRERYLFEMFKELRDMSPWKKMEFLNETEQDYILKRLKDLQDKIRLQKDS